MTRESDGKINLSKGDSIMKIIYQGHSCFIVQGSKESVIIDPFLNGNPLAKISAKDVLVDWVLVTHGHGDHMGDAVEISKKNKAPIIGTFELVNHCSALGASGHAMHIGGSHDFPFGKVKLTIAFHGSSSESGPMGNPCGFLVTMDGKTVYHAGDTGLFSDMALLAGVDCALLPIGDNFTMGIEDAVKAAVLIKPKLAVPMHYNTFDLIKQDPKDFGRGCEKAGIKARILNPGEAMEI